MWTMGCGSSLQVEPTDPPQPPPTTVAGKADTNTSSFGKAEILHGVHHGASAATAEHADQPIAKYYEFGSEIGKGSYALVYEAWRRTDRLKVAVKAIDTHAVNYRSGALDAEVSLLQRIHHPNVIELIEVFESANHFYMVMEFVDGGELFEQIVDRGHYSEADASSIMRQILLAVQLLHGKDIIHRDLKPENLLYHTEPSGDITVKVADFGLATVCHEGVLLKQPCGTPGYVAPEVLNRMKIIEGYGKPVDMWSCGVILYILLCGEPPFYHENMRELFKLICSGKYSFPSPDWDDVSANAVDLVRKLLVVDPSKRLTADQALEHPWIREDQRHDDLKTNIQGQLRKFNARTRLKMAMSTIMTVVHVRRSMTGLADIAANGVLPSPHDLMAAAEDGSLVATSTSATSIASAATPASPAPPKALGRSRSRATSQTKH